jgi:putative FmdB family regulatory protein
MPIYEYHCDRCDQTFEVIQKFSDDPVLTHESCGGPVERLISTSALQFKGTGWYITDYAKKNGSSPAKGEGAGGSASSEGSAKSESSAKSEGSSKSESSSKSEGSAKPAASTASTTSANPPASK